MGHMILQPCEHVQRSKRQDEANLQRTPRPWNCNSKLVVAIYSRPLSRTSISSENLLIERIQLCNKIHKTPSPSRRLKSWTQKCSWNHGKEGYQSLGSERSDCNSFGIFELFQEIFKMLQNLSQISQSCRNQITPRNSSLSLVKSIGHLQFRNSSGPRHI